MNRTNAMTRRETWGRLPDGRLHLVVDLGCGEALELVEIPAGRFIMGSEAAKSEFPPHPVKVSRGFMMSVTPVTQGQFSALSPQFGSDFPLPGLDEAERAIDLAPPTDHDYQPPVISWDNKLHDRRRPMISLDWFEAIDLCNRLSALVGLKCLYPKLPSGFGKRNQQFAGYAIPTEAEWEFACRGNTTSPYHWGTNFRDDLCWYKANSMARPHDVRRHPPNPFGLHDMLGNTQEWCEDWFGSYPDMLVADPTGPTSGVHKVLRGGSWSSIPSACRCAARHAASPDQHLLNTGIRICRTLPEDERSNILSTFPMPQSSSSGGKADTLFHRSEVWRDNILVLGMTANPSTLDDLAATEAALTQAQGRAEPGPLKDALLACVRLGFVSSWWKEREHRNEDSMVQTIARHRQDIVSKSGLRPDLLHWAVTVWQEALVLAAAEEIRAREVSRTLSMHEQAASKTATRRTRRIDCRQGVFIDFIEIPAGEFLMGESGFSAREEPVHRVRISRPFWMSVWPVTQLQQATVDSPHTPAPDPQTRERKGRRVASDFTWRRAVQFCNRLSQLKNLTPFYCHDPETSQSLPWNHESCGFRLPTEAEWEYACRAGTTTRYYWGEDMARKICAAADERYYEDVPVGSYPPNPWGLHDMLGFIWQMCHDSFGEYPANDVTDPHGSRSDNWKVIRGGMAGIDLKYSRCACRETDYQDPDENPIPIGLRLVLPVDAG